MNAAHHGSPVVGGGDGVKPLLASSVPDLQFDPLPFQLYCLDFEVNSWEGEEVQR